MRFPTGQTALSFAVRISGVAFGLGSGALVARVLQPEKFGAYALVLALVAVFSLPSTMGLRQTIARETAYAVSLNNPERRMAIWVWAGRMALLASLASAAALALIAAVFVEDAAQASHFLVGAAILVLVPAPQVIGGALQGLGLVVRGQIPEHTLRQLALVLFVLPLWLYATPGETAVTNVLWLYAAAVAIAAIAGAVMLRVSAPFSLAQGRAGQAQIEGRALAGSALSFGAIAGLHMVMTNFDVIMLGILSTREATGLYKVAITLSGVVSFGLVVINGVILPRIAALHKTGERAALQELVTQAARRTTLVAAIGMVFLLGLGSWLIPFVFGASYSEAMAPLKVLILGQFVNAVFGPVAIVLNMTGNERLTLIVSAGAMVLNMALNLLLIPLYGMLGAAVATAGTLALWNCVAALVLWRTAGVDSSIFGRMARQ